MNFLRRLHDLYRGDVDPDWPSDLRYILPVVIFVILTGPLIIWVYAMQDWCAGSSWDSEDRWQGTRAFAVTFLLGYLPLILFRGDLAQFWPHVFGAPGWHNPLLWWCWCVPLAPALALLSERLDPRTKPLERILLPSELPPPQPTPAQEKSSPVRTARRKKSTAKPNENRVETSAARQRKKARDPRPGEQVWAPPQLVLPQSPSEGVSKSSSDSSVRSARQAKKDERDEGESLKDIF